MSIKNTLRKTLIIFSIVPIIIVSVLAYQLISSRLVKVSSDKLQQLAETNSNGLEALINNQKTEISLLSMQNDVKSFTSYSNTVSLFGTTFYDAIYNIVYDLLKQRSSLYPSVERLTIYNINKKVIACSDDSHLGEDYLNSATLSYINATGNTAFGVNGLMSYYDKYEKKNYGIEIGFPIFEYTGVRDKIIGYVVSTINISYFEDFLNSIEMGKTGFGIVLDKSGKIIYHPVTSLIGTATNSEKLRKLVNSFYKGEIEKSGTFKYYQDRTDKVFGYSVIPELNWVLLVKQNTSEIIDLANIIFYVLGWTVFLLIILVISVSNSITKTFTDPIIELKDAMLTASDGNLEVQTNIKTNNELGELSRSFNKMIHIIKSNYKDLTDMHEELIANEDQLRSNYNHIEFLAYHDVLTNLPNKMAFIEKVTSVMESSQSTNQVHAVYFVDLDNFKTVNDTLGHDYGDNLLAQTAKQLYALTSTDDILARAGGDEFLIFLKNVDSEDSATQFAKDVLDTFEKPFNLNGELAYVSMSIGIALYPKNGTTTGSLIKNADIAMYKSKETGKNKYTLFDQSMDDELSRNKLILETLRHAIFNKEIFINYQPQFNIFNNKIVGFEALMRINSSKLGPISPSEFIPIAEESGLIVELGEWILREACVFNKSLMDQGFTNYIVSVNISSVQINRQGFVSMIADILRETQLPPEYLEIEITESTLVSSLLDATTLLHNLQSLGIRISLDDFGTGYSSLNYLTTMPINTLKIDKSFIDNILHSEKDYQIADTIIQLAHSLDIEVIAEGVEDADQLKMLRHKKCDMVQGYVYSKPLLPAALIEILHT